MSLLDTIKSIFCSKKPESVESPAPAESAHAEPAPEVKSEPAPAPAPAPAPEKPAVVEKVVAAESSSISIPEDATLRRHFIAQLKADIESSMPARPTDSTLKRHYDASVQAELDKILG